MKICSWLLAIVLLALVVLAAIRERIGNADFNW